MKTSFFAPFVLMFASLLAQPALARNQVMTTFNNIVVTDSSNKPVSADEVKKAIDKIMTKKGWSIKPVAEGKMSASIFVRGRHRVELMVNYSASRYSFEYISSEAMDYIKRPDGVIEINAAYNLWLEAAIKEIGFELKKL